MPYTNDGMAEGGGHNWLHFWLRDGDEIVAGNTEALCGDVHANPGTDLVRLTELEWEGDEEDLAAFLSREETCTECADRLREHLGLELRELEEISGVGANKAEALRRRGYHSPRDLRYASQGEIAEEVPEIGNALAARIKAEVGTEVD